MHESEGNMKYGIFVVCKSDPNLFFGIISQTKTKKKERLELDRFGGCNDLARRGCLKK